MIRIAPQGRRHLLRVGSFLAIALLVAVVTGCVWMAGVAGIVALFLLVLAFFFRDPDRVPPEGAGLVLAPGDGKVVEVAREEFSELAGGPCTRVSIFLSVFDVHVQRSPVSGRICHRSYHPGGYRAAWRKAAGQSNEQATLGIDTAGERVWVTQIAGLVARRIHTFPEEGDQVVRGGRIGLIEFGSRVETLVPGHWPVRVEAGDRARGGLTVIAERPQADVDAPLTDGEEPTSVDEAPPAEDPRRG